MAFTKDLRPAFRSRYNRALNLLQVSGRTRIGHVDTGISRHPALGFDAAGNPPQNLLLAEGRDFLDPGSPPFSPLREPESTLQCIRNGKPIGDCLTDYPDHGTKTLSVILSNSGNLTGLAPGASVIPVRIADGPIFENNSQRDNMGPAIHHLLGLSPVPRVISISMGNPGHAGVWQVLFSAFGADAGFNKVTRGAFDAAYRAGVIVVCAAGQLIDRVIYPARYKTTIAVGGIRQDGINHYPNDDYDIPERVYIWTQADGINRALSYIENDAPKFSYAEQQMGDGTDDVSGTSYAAPQVAAAAALWVESNFHDLPEPGDVDAWKTVEAFRAALVGSAQQVSLKIPSTGKRVTRPRLDIHQLLGHAPNLPLDDAHAPETLRHSNQR
ncbi:MAG TPA: S8/S53 family peptidase [Thermohalobaculum sp.]|nr:S8/S53 family peptidase [Thermohalobaculum sp.]